MKKWTKKVWMSAAAVLIAIMSVSAIPVSADVSRVVYFTFQNNNACAPNTHYTTLYFNITNLSNSTADVTLHLYNEAGVELNDTLTTISPPGTTGINGYYSSNIIPNNTFALNGKTTKHYLRSFGGAATNLSCTDRPAYGKIVVETDEGIILANGEIKGVQSSPYIILSSTPITVNGGQPF